ncbi:hypothetical protein GCM10010218_23780 [Streptomyces mashuensis]|uniref:OmpR/PhoB-type domain-containing protein n=1 Tax=Streptomyces mashuensis TaxID=33904 RepID=A0A919ECM7_9ACTN|nr:AfsR/SARP family transcriptional regulator [Streptomyces mashuensis]GHF41954.1 hypothetical protein GCM10010218_23780 [Streptomyces mashuensis]
MVGMAFGVLGTLDLYTVDGTQTIRGPKLSKVFALLLSRPNRFVGLDLLIEELWEERPPRSAVMTVRTHVHHLRKVLKDHRFAAGAQPLIESKPNGYVLRTAQAPVDAEVFRQLTAAGRDLLAEERLQDASAAFRRALALWRGPVLDGIEHGPALQRYAADLAEQRRRVLEMRLHADMRLGRYCDIVGELRQLIAAQPLDEWLHGLLIDALRRSGRRAEALGAYQKLRSLLKDELGLEPSQEVQRIQHEILSRAA